MCKCGCFAWGWLAGAVSVMAASLIADTLQQFDAIFEKKDVGDKIEAEGQPEV